MVERGSREALSFAIGLCAVASAACTNTDKPGGTAGYTKIDDMEREGGRIAWAPPDGWPAGRQSGFWASSTDCTERDRILPEPYFMNPAGWSYEAVPQPHPTMPGVISTSAVHLRTRLGQSLQGVWGANAGFDFADDTDTAVDGAAAWPATSSADGGGLSDDLPCSNGSSRDFNGVPVDLGAYSGITFWAMAWAEGRQSIRVQLNDPHTDPRANRCSSSRDTDEDRCYNSFAKAFMLTDRFTQYHVDFSELRQDPSWGYQPGVEPFDRQHVYSLNFLVALPGCAGKKSNANCAGDPVPVSFDVWIDDLYFVNRP